MARASSSTDGAMTASMNVETMARAGAASIGAIQRHDAAKRRQRVGVARADIRIGRAAARRGAAGIRVLDHRGGGLVELEHDARRRIEIQQVGVREFLACEDLRGAPAPSPAPRVPRRRWCGFSP
jgi:hypothetical protein